MITLAALLDGSRVLGLRTAAVAALKETFPEVQVKAWPGKLNVQDMVAKTGILPPAILVAVTGQRPPDSLVSGVADEPVAFTAYVVAENKAVGVPKRLYLGDEIGLALCGALVRLLSTEAGRWDVADAGHPEEVHAQPVFTLAGLDQGTAFFTVTWRQTLHGQGAPWPRAAEGEIAPPAFVPGFPAPGSDWEVPL